MRVRKIPDALAGIPTNSQLTSTSRQATGKTAMPLSPNLGRKAAWVEMSTSEHGANITTTYNSHVNTHTQKSTERS